MPKKSSQAAALCSRALRSSVPDAASTVQPGATVTPGFTLCHAASGTLVRQIHHPARGCTG